MGRACSAASRSAPPTTTPDCRPDHRPDRPVRPARKARFGRSVNVARPDGCGERVEPALPRRWLRSSRPGCDGAGTGEVAVRAPGQAEEIAFSTRPGGTGPGSHMRISIPEGVMTYSKLT